MRAISVFPLFILAAVPAISGDLEHSYQPKEGFVPLETTAKQIAEAVLVPIYGQKLISAQKPFKVVLKDGVWIVEGSTPADRGALYVGGNFTVHISKMTGEILQLSHSK
jgi:hypothetical protein